MQNANMIMSIFVFYGQKKGIPSENPFLFRKELKVKDSSFEWCITCYSKLSLDKLQGKDQNFWDISRTLWSVIIVLELFQKLSYDLSSFVFDFCHIVHEEKC